MNENNDAIIAMTLAPAGINFDPGKIDMQIGGGVSSYNGKLGWAAGIAKKVDRTLFNGHVTFGEGGNKAIVGGFTRSF